MLGAACVALGSLAGLSADAVAQRITGREATVPKAPAAAAPFRMSHPRGHFHALRDGEPTTEDAPQLWAVAGGAELWFEDYYITARNILLWTDPVGVKRDDQPTGDPQGYPYPAQPPRVPGSLPVGIGAVEGATPVSTSFGDLRELYAEGDVYITQGKTKIIQADKFYFNLIEDRSLIIGGEIRTDTAAAATLDPTAQQKGKASDDDGSGSGASRTAVIPLTIRAAEIRGVSRGLYEAEDASLTTSTFAVPGYHVAMDRVIYEERRDELGGRVSGYNNRFILGDRELVSLDYLTFRAGVDEPFPLLRLDLGVSSRYGAFAATRWGGSFFEAGEKFNKSIGVEGTFTGTEFVDVNLYSARGLGLGAGVTYETVTNGQKKYFGSTEFFVINDLSGDDQTSKQQEPGWRGRFKSLNRSFLESGLQVDTELYYLSDRTFVREFFERDVDQEKVPETLVYLKKLDGDSALTGLARFRINSWQTQTQYLPQVTYDVISRPVFEFDGFTDLLDADEPVRGYWTHRTDIALVDRKHGDTGNSEEGSAFRIDDVERLNMPFDIGQVGIDPYVEGRVTSWAGDGLRDGGSAARLGLTFGFNASTQYWRTDPDVESEFWNIHGIRHIVVPSLRYRWTFLSTEQAEDLVPYDNVERFDTLHAVVPGIESRYQTKRLTRRGPETVEFLRLEALQPIVFENGRADDQDTIGPLHLEARYRPDLDRYFLRRSSMRTSLDYDWANGGEVAAYRAEFSTEPGPDFFARVAYSFADRGRIAPTLLFDGLVPQNRRRRPLNAFSFEFAYQATRVWEFVVQQQFDISGQNGGLSSLLLRRRSADWMFEFGLGAPVIGAGSGVIFSISPAATFERPERDRFRVLLPEYDLTPIFEESPYSPGAALGERPGR